MSAEILLELSFVTRNQNVRWERILNARKLVKRNCLVAFTLVGNSVALFLKGNIFV